MYRPPSELQITSSYSVVVDRSVNKLRLSLFRYPRALWWHWLVTCGYESYSNVNLSHLSRQVTDSRHRQDGGWRHPSACNNCITVLVVWTATTRDSSVILRLRDVLNRTRYNIRVAARCRVLVIFTLFSDSDCYQWGRLSAVVLEYRLRYSANFWIQWLTNIKVFITKRFVLIWNFVTS